MNNKTFMTHFPGFCLQTFDDKADRKDRSLTTYGKPTKSYVMSLFDLNKRGAGVFFTVNAFPGGVRKASECKGVNAWFFEIDGVSKEEQWERINAAPVKPSFVVETRNSLHCYYLAIDATIDKFKLIQQGLIKYFDADSACKDVSRVLRVPGFYHNKGEPFMVKLVSSYGAKYSEQQMLESFPFEEIAKKEVSPKKNVKTRDYDLWEAASRLDNKTMLERLSGTQMVNGEHFTFKSRSTGGEYIEVNGQAADAWIDEHGMIGSGKGGGPTYIQWLEYYGASKGDIAKWLKDDCSDLLPKKVLKKSKKTKAEDSLTQPQQLLEVFEKQNPVLFRNEMDEAYVQVDLQDSKQIMMCESNKFEKYLRRLFWQETSIVMGNENIKKVVALIAAKAEYGDKKIQLYNRVALYDGDFWYDLGNSRVLRCGKNEWQIVKDLPILFCSHQHQEPQGNPIKEGADINIILNYVRIRTQEQQILFMVWLVSCFIPEIPHPILVLFGEKGASKSTTMRFARMLIDPSKANLLSLPRADELVQQLAHHYAAFYDNVNDIKQSVSDILCRAVTGAGASKRRLFTNDDDVIYKYRRVIAVNGINNVVQAPDLLDRSILIELERVPKSERKTELELLKKFSKDAPYILGGVFNVLSKARALFDEVSLNDFPRMADFAKWGYAIAEALGFDGEVFVKAYEANINQQNDEVIENDPVAHALSIFMEDKDSWEGAPTALHEELLHIFEDTKMDAKTLPKSASSLGRHINIVKSNLLEAGIEIDKAKDTNGKRGRLYVISKVAVAPVAVVAEVSNEDVDSDTSDVCDETLQNDERKTQEDFMSGAAKLGDLPFDDQVEVVTKVINS